MIANYFFKNRSGNRKRSRPSFITRDPAPPVRMEIVESGVQKLIVKFSGNLNSYTISDLWQHGLHVVREVGPRTLVLDLRGVDYCDGSGIGFLIDLNSRMLKSGGRCEMINLKEEFKKLLEIFEPQKPFEITAPETIKISPVENLGMVFVKWLDHFKDQVSFMGEMIYTVSSSFKQAKKIRWPDVWNVVEVHGVNALPIVCLINFLMGLIIAFQSAIMLRLFGAEVFVANGVGLAMVRVLGPLMTAIVLSGRTGSSFAAEIGTMKVNDEVNAIRTMGLNPMKFLAVSRVLGVLFLIPVLTLFADVCGILGGVTVMAPMGQSTVDYFSRVFESVTLSDFFIGIIKSFIFGMVIASVGCLKGFRTKAGASAVGESATEAVVNCLFLLILIEGMASVVCYFLGI
jgi:phospholipid/cholesterol/gamma-HCH transport system permease protein